MDEYNTNMSGYLEIILGCMYSGKTSKLISIYKHNKIAEIPTCVINYIHDDRYDKNDMSTHDGLTIPCKKVEKLFEMCSSNNSKIFKTTQAFIINEGQFFEDLFDFVYMLVNKYKKKVYVGGLDGDFQMKKFGTILDLIPLCDKVEKLKAICNICKRPASFTKRITKDKRQEIIGGTEMYIPVCRECHFKS
jgi:thymidine kinase